MATVATLFDTASAARAAVAALDGTVFADLDPSYYGREDGDGVVALPDPGRSRILAAPYATSFLNDLDRDRRQFLVDGVRDGGVLLLAEVDDEHAAALENIWRRHGGRVRPGD